MWDAISAISTFLAVIVALGISVYSSRSSAKSEMDRAELAAAKMLSPISTLTWKVSGLFAFFAFRPEEGDVSTASTLKLIDELEALSSSITIDDLYPLLKLPSHAAKRSARALGLIHTLIADVRAVMSHPYWEDGLPASKGATYQSWIGLLSEIKDLLEVSERVCEASARSGAPRPTSDEIHLNEQGEG
jgi:hypothetical protein